MSVTLFAQPAPGRQARGFCTPRAMCHVQKLHLSSPVASRAASLSFAPQFWNCAEIKIVGKSAKRNPASGPAVAALNAPATPRPKKNKKPTSAPTVFQPCLRASSSAYFEATADCTGYYFCKKGVQGKVVRCSGYKMLYDEVQQMCNWATEVDCGANRVPQKPAVDAAGSPLPATAPTPLPPDGNPLLAWPGPKTAAERGHDKTIIAYYASWQWYDRNGLAAPAAFDWNKVRGVSVVSM